MKDNKNYLTKLELRVVIKRNRLFVTIKEISLNESAEQFYYERCRKISLQSRLFLQTVHNFIRGARQRKTLRESFRTFQKLIGGENFVELNTPNNCIMFNFSLHLLLIKLFALKKKRFDLLMKNVLQLYNEQNHACFIL